MAVTSDHTNAQDIWKVIGLIVGTPGLAPLQQHPRRCVQGSLLHRKRWVMSAAAGYSPLEILLLVQSLAKFGPHHATFSRVSDILASKDSAKDSNSSANIAGRLGPDALRSLYSSLVAEETEQAANGRGANEAATSFNDPTPSGTAVKTPIIPRLVEHYYVKYRESAIKGIREDEARYRELRRQIIEIERGQSGHDATRQVSVPPAGQRLAELAHGAVPQLADLPRPVSASSGGRASPGKGYPGQLSPARLPQSTVVGSPSTTAIDKDQHLPQPHVIPNVPPQSGPGSNLVGRQAEARIFAQSPVSIPLPPKNTLVPSVGQSPTWNLESPGSSVSIRPIEDSCISGTPFPPKKALATAGVQPQQGTTIHAPAVIDGANPVASTHSLSPSLRVMGSLGPKPISGTPQSAPFQSPVRQPLFSSIPTSPAIARTATGPKPGAMSSSSNAPSHSPLRPLVKTTTADLVRGPSSTHQASGLNSVGPSSAPRKVLSTSSESRNVRPLSSVPSAGATTSSSLHSPQLPQLPSRASTFGPFLQYPPHPPRHPGPSVMSLSRPEGLGGGGGGGSAIKANPYARSFTPDISSAAPQAPVTPLSSTTDDRRKHRPTVVSMASASSTRWKTSPSDDPTETPRSPLRPPASPLSDAESPFQSRPLANSEGTSRIQLWTDSRDLRAAGFATATSVDSELPVTRRGTRRGEPIAARRKRRAGSIASSTSQQSTEPRTRSQSIAASADDMGALLKIKHERPSTPAGLPNELDAEMMEEAEGSDITHVTSGRGRAGVKPPRSPTTLKRKRHDSLTNASETADDPGISPGLAIPPTGARYVHCTPNFARISAPLLNDIVGHKLAGIFTKPVNARDAPNYLDLIYQPQDLKSIKSAITAGSRAVAAAASAVNTPAEGPDSPATGIAGSSTPTKNAAVLAPPSADFMPPKSIVNSAQFEREIMRMFANAVMFNQDPDRAFGKAFCMARGGGDGDEGEQESAGLGNNVEEDGGVVKDTREMFETVERTVSEWRKAERGRVQL